MEPHLAQLPTARYVDLFEAEANARTEPERRRAQDEMEDYLEKHGLIGTVLHQQGSFGMDCDRFEFEIADGRRIVCIAWTSGKAIAELYEKHSTWSVQRLSGSYWLVSQNRLAAKRERALVGVVSA